MEPGELMS
jgi:hypothetical protein